LTDKAGSDMKKKIGFMDTSFRDGFQSCFGARVKTSDFIPALEAAVAAGTTNFEIGGGARFQSLYFYCQEDAFDMMDKCREVVGPDINLQTLARGANVVGLTSQSRDIIDLHAKLFKKHGVSTIRNFDALNDVRNLEYSGNRIDAHGLKHQVVVTLMALPAGIDKGYAHSPKFYIDCIQKILDAEIPYDSVCFKDASGTCTPKTVFETISGARKLLPKDTIIQFHTHDTAGMAVVCNMAAIEAGADIIDLSMQPCSGGTGQCDILTMWHNLKGSNYTLDIDYKKVMEAEEIFLRQMKEYYLPPEALSVNPMITFSPMPGGALTANTQMMRDNNCLHLFTDVIKEMEDVVSRGGYGTSVTPVSQFYFQQAFSNVTQGKWKKITDSYAKMVLGYFGRTPADPDPEVVKLASQQQGLEPTKENVHDINDRNSNLGIDAAIQKLKEAELPETEENIFIVATCTDKGIEYLKGNKPLGIRYKKDMTPTSEPVQKKTSEPAEELHYTITVEGKPHTYFFKSDTADTQYPIRMVEDISSSTLNEDENELRAPMPASICKILVKEGDKVKADTPVLILEAMKMESEILMENDGTIVRIAVKQGQTVAHGDVMMIIKNDK
jgi:pyruvate carboxylase subunit B